LIDNNEFFYLRGKKGHSYDRPPVYPLRIPLPFLRSASTAFLQIDSSWITDPTVRCSSNTGVRIIADPCSPGKLYHHVWREDALPSPKRTASIQ